MKGPDAEASWLLSQAYLQEGLLGEALAALKDSGSFADEDPTLPDPGAAGRSSPVRSATARSSTPSNIPAMPGPSTGPSSSVTWSCLVRSSPIRSSRR